MMAASFSEGKGRALYSKAASCSHFRHFPEAAAAFTCASRSGLEAFFRDAISASMSRGPGSSGAACAGGGMVLTACMILAWAVRGTHDRRTPPKFSRSISSGQSSRHTDSFSAANVTALRMTSSWAHLSGLCEAAAALTTTALSALVFTFFRDATTPSTSITPAIPLCCTLTWSTRAQPRAMAETLFCILIAPFVLHISFNKALT
mmetsp:Transcript_8920/g.22426  ORF Transcript_8920/g.22426 Transcript_8920/m.22426 type:complete len:205 (-) Transcript_8920:2-616(-)